MAVLGIVVGMASVRGQFGTTNQFTLSEAQVDGVDTDVEGEFAAIEALVDDQHWDEAVGRLRALAEQAESGIVLVNEESGLYVSLEEACQRMISHLPPPGLMVYRQRVDGLAEAWYQQAIRERSEPLLERIVRQLFASSLGDDALFALGELALARGDYSGARRAWERITPLARDPERRPLWIALAGIDVRARWHEIEPLLANPGGLGGITGDATGEEEDRGAEAGGAAERGRARSLTLVYPDTDLDVAQVLARLVLVSIREGAFDRAETELAVLEGLYPEATGRLGGKDRALIEALSEQLHEARTWPPLPSIEDWPTFAGAPDRNGMAAAAPDAVGHVVWRVTLDGEERQADRRQSGRGQLEPRHPERALSVHPILVGDTVLYGDRSHIYALDLERGESAVTGRSDGVLYAPEREPSQAAFQPGRGSYGIARYTLTAAEGIVFGRTGSPLTSRPETARLAGDERVVGLEVAGGRLRLRFLCPETAGPSKARRWFNGTASWLPCGKVTSARGQSSPAIAARAAVSCGKRLSQRRIRPPDRVGKRSLTSCSHWPETRCITIRISAWSQHWVCEMGGSAGSSDTTGPAVGTCRNWQATSNAT
jgi:hypothetical protein